MNAFLVSLLLCLIECGQTYAQQGTYNIAAGYGFYQAPHYKHAQNKDYFVADFNFQLSDQWVISSGFLSGRFNYFDDFRSNAIAGAPYDPYTNSQGYEAHTYLTLSRVTNYNNRLSFQVGTGIGLFTQRLKYPYAAPSSYSGPRGLPIFTAEESFSTVEIPIRVDIFYRINDRISVGLKAGTFVQKGPSLVSNNIGPQVKIKL